MRTILALATLALMLTANATPTAAQSKPKPWCPPGDPNGCDIYSWHKPPMLTALSVRLGR